MVIAGARMIEGCKGFRLEYAVGCWWSSAWIGGAVMDVPEVRQKRERMTIGGIALVPRPALRPGLAPVPPCVVAA